jgi:hypothetical protein
MFLHRREIDMALYWLASMDGKVAGKGQHARGKAICPDQTLTPGIHRHNVSKEMSNSWEREARSNTVFSS